MKNYMLPALRFTCSYLLFITIGLLAPALCGAQDVFIKTYDYQYTDKANTLTVLSNGRIALAGATAAQSTGQQHLMLMIAKEDGTVALTKTYSTGQRLEALDMLQTADGNLLIAFDIFNSGGEAKAGWMKVNPANGAVVWSKTAVQACRLPSITKLQDGYLLTGDYVISATDRDALAVKINESGDVVWYKIFGETGFEQLGECWQDPLGLIHCSGYHIEITESQGIYVKFDATGNIPGAIQRYSIGDNTDLLSFIAPLSNGGFMLAGNSQGFNDNYARAWILTTDIDGKLKSSYTYGLAQKHIGITDMRLLPNDEFVFSLGRPAPSGTPAVLMKLNANYDMLWQNTYKSDGEGEMLWQVEPYDDGFVAAGTRILQQKTNFLLAKTDKKGISGDCCSNMAPLVRTQVTPEQTAIVAEETTGFSAQNLSITIADAAPNTRTHCLSIKLDFDLADSTLCPGECTTFALNDSTEGATYTLEIKGAAPDPNDPERLCHTDGGVIAVTRTGVFNGCSVSLQKSIKVGAKKDAVPNAFTPNGDGFNDVFRPVFPCEVINSRLMIYSRWGEMVFETSDPATGWDGQYNDQSAPSDVYAWRLEYEAIRDGKQQIFTENGSVTLLR